MRQQSQRNKFAVAICSMIFLICVAVSIMGIIALFMFTPVAKASGRAAMPDDLRRDSVKLEAAVFDPLSAVMDDIGNGKIKKGSSKSTVAMCEAVHVGFKEAGYSLDATFQYIFQQHDAKFWQTTFRSAGYSNLLRPCLSAFKNEQIMDAMRDKGVVTEKTLEVLSQHRALLKTKQ